MTNEREEALRLARVALTECIRRLDSTDETDSDYPMITPAGAREALAAVESALARAQPQQEPVAWIPAHELEFLKKGSYRESVVFNFRNHPDGIMPLYASPPAQAIPEGCFNLLKRAQEHLQQYADDYPLDEGAFVGGDPLRVLLADIGAVLAVAPKPGGKSA